MLWVQKEGLGVWVWFRGSGDEGLGVGVSGCRLQCVKFVVKIEGCGIWCFTPQSVGVMGLGRACEEGRAVPVPRRRLSSNLMYGLGINVWDLVRSNATRSV